MSTSNAINLSQLPAPAVIETLGFEALLAQMVSLVQTGVPGVFTGIPDFAPLDSDPAMKVLQAAAYCRMLDRARVNDAARAVMVAYAQGADLDHLGALFQVERLTDEGDDAFRARIVLAPDGFSVAGPESAYKFHALSADPDVLDASVTSPAAGEVLVTVLSKTGDGTASTGLIDAVTEALNDKTIRPLTDLVTVQSAEIIDYEVEAEIYTYEGPDSAVILTAAIAGRDAYIAAQRRLGRDVTLSGLNAAMFVPGVQRVVITTPEADVVCDDTQAANCTAATTTHAGTAE